MSSTEITRKTHPWLGDFGYFDPSYYAKAVSCDDLRRMDYNIARVFNNPAYSNRLVQDFTGNIESTKLIKLPIVSLESTDQSVSSLIEIINVIDGHFNNLDETDAELSRKSLAWYLVSTDLFSDLHTGMPIPEYLFDYMTQLCVIAGDYDVRFVHLHKLCGSRGKATRGRELLFDVIKLIGGKV